MTSLFRRIAAWLAVNFPSDEQLAAPENEADIRRRMNELESLRAIARQRVAEIHQQNTTRSPLNRRSA